MYLTYEGLKDFPWLNRVLQPIRKGIGIGKEMKMKKISLKEIAFPLDVNVIKKILQSNGIVKVVELSDMEGFYLLDEKGVLIPSTQILEMVWEQYLGLKIADYIKTIKADGFHIDPKKQLLILYYLPEDREEIEGLRKKNEKLFHMKGSFKGNYIS